ncbi:DedA family protein [Candidatus Parcubacteria bacterium]|jgi:membrane protein DedA with SNARE-associated domain|nr:MAG: DedA family protein [Candidatus Parcubacteria bacterium]
MGLTEFIVHYATLIIEKTSYFGMGILMVMESMVFPVPSEGVMPFAGFLWYDGKLNFWLIVLASTVGSIIGSLISYFIGKYGGRPFVKKFGRYFLLNEHHLDQTENFFQKYGQKTIFISRFIPVVRHLISIPAGVGNMPLGKFCLYTVLGAGIWNAILTWAGFLLGKSWESIRKYSEMIDYAILVLILVGIAYLIYRRKRNLPSTIFPPKKE